MSDSAGCFMNVNVIRELFRRKPFVPLEIILDNGLRHRCPSPEVLISPHFVVWVSAEGHPIIIEPDAISEVRVVPVKNGRQRKPRGS
ncbi:MAG: hypothetical protein HY719_09020 [Planctomycetes bacterium]|nr:hypothetical protein [Planctomycetota bacterium]